MTIFKILENLFHERAAKEIKESLKSTGNER